MERGLQALHAAFLALTALVLVSGVYLVFFFRPVEADAWDDIFALQDGIRFGQVVQQVHQWGTVLWLVILVPLAITEAVRRSAKSAIMFVSALLLGVAVIAAGLYLPWDQIALGSITVGTDITGFRPVFDDDVLFVLIDGTEISATTIRRAFVLHVVGGTIAIVLAVATTTAALRSKRSNQT